MDINKRLEDLKNFLGEEFRPQVEELITINEGNDKYYLTKTKADFISSIRDDKLWYSEGKSNYVGAELQIAKGYLIINSVNSKIVNGKI